jgi:hypothetical protein
MYIEDNIEKNISYTHIFNEKENKFIIIEELKQNISMQFLFKNLGHNYLNDYPDLPLEIYDWFLTYIENNYFAINDLISIYDQIDKMKFLSHIIYEFLFVDIVQVFSKLNLTNTFRSEIIRYLVDGLQSLQTMKQELINSEVIDNSNIEKEILKFSTLISVFDTNLEMFEENYLKGILYNIVI